MKKISVLKKIKRWTLISIIAFNIISILLVLLYKYVPVPITFTMMSRCVEQWRKGDDIVLKKEWTSYNKIPNNIQLAVVCCEDQNYLEHNGFDFGAIKKAINHNQNNKKVRGASTISQQVAKNVFLWQGRSYLRKALEVYYTFLIELFWSKERILCVYLNIAETGNGIYGVAAASKFFFNKELSKISNSQAATIAVCLPNPRLFNIGKPSGYIIKRRKWCLNQMKLWGGKLYIDEQNNDSENERNTKSR